MADSLVFHGLLPRALGARSLGCRILSGRVYLDSQALCDPLVRLLREPERGAAAGAMTALAFVARAPLLVLRLARSLLRIEALERECCDTLERLTQELERQPMSSLEDEALIALLRLLPSEAFRDELVRVPPVGLLAQYCAPAAYTALRHMLRRWTSELPETASVLISGLHGMVDVECATALWDLAEEARRIPKLARALLASAPRMARVARLSKAASFRTGLQALLNRFGHRGAGEAELQRPRWREDPEPLLAVIASYLTLGPEASPHLAEWRQHWEREKALERVRLALRLRPLRRFVFERTLTVAQRASLAASSTRFEMVRLYSVMRGAALELGRRLALAGRLERSDDVFFLLLGELHEHAAADLRMRVAERRAQHARDAANEPALVVDGEGRPLEHGGFPPGLSATLRGIAASPGRARGRVSILRASAPSLAPHRGSVLVAPHADPAWTPLFAVASAVVLETGGLLSPGSVIARELGIPSVVAVPGATNCLREGEEVEVDGSNGTVTRLGGAAEEAGQAA